MSSNRIVPSSHSRAGGYPCDCLRRRWFGGAQPLIGPGPGAGGKWQGAVKVRMIRHDCSSLRRRQRDVEQVHVSVGEHCFRRRPRCSDSVTFCWTGAEFAHRGSGGSVRVPRGAEKRFVIPPECFRSESAFAIPAEHPSTKRKRQRRETKHGPFVKSVPHYCVTWAAVSASL